MDRQSAVIPISLKVRKGTLKLRMREAILKARQEIMRDFPGRFNVRIESIRCMDSLLRVNMMITGAGCGMSKRYCQEFELGGLVQISGDGSFWPKVIPAGVLSELESARIIAAIWQFAGSSHTRFRDLLRDISGGRITLKCESGRGNGARLNNHQGGLT
jgi:hypothetical protein